MSYLLYFCSASILGYCLWQLNNWRVWVRLTKFRVPPPGPVHSLALIIPFRNEANNLSRLFASILQQDFPREQLEIIFVDDSSTDKGRSMVETFIRETAHADLGAAAGAKKWEGIKPQTTGLNVRLLDLTDHLRTRKTVAHKKEALTYAINSTEQEIILTTDADCTLPPTLLRTVAATFRDGVQVVSGPVANGPLKSFCDTFQALDLASYQFLTAVQIEVGKPVLANGACFAFRRSAFHDVNGYVGVDHLPSGDDVLLLHKFRDAFPGNAFRWLKAGPVTLTAPVRNWKALWNQRLRWAGKAGNYQAKELERAQNLAVMAALSVLLLLVVIILTDYTVVMLWLWLVKIIIDGICLWAYQRHYRQPFPIIGYLKTALIHPFFLVGIAVAHLRGKKPRWKGRAT
ncbi:glycosyltransferase [Lewinella sp. 4G2]|uniref:glycosyltransferase n=1 Tax=Lewinella sp. 4G2 TaxID=1803372 RepID=UPI0007B4604B|nr:glycosyltransferase [Lewinella sp. 4G2]OAV44873.1 hypothetical protein A3850_010385 [Lewinella sp. 4G2]